MADVLPNRLVKVVDAHLAILAETLAAESIPISTSAAIIRMLNCITVRQTVSRAEAVKGVAAVPADQQSLQQPARPPPGLPLAIAVLLQLLGRRIKQFLTDEGRNGDGNAPLLSIVDRIRPARLLGLSTGWSQSWPARTHLGPAELGRALVSRMPQHVEDRPAVPVLVAGLRSNALGPQATTHLAQSEPITADPIENLSNDAGLLKYDIEASDTTTVRFADVSIPIRCRCESTDATLLRRVKLATATALQEFRTLVLGDHALHLEQQLIFGTAIQRSVEENHLDATAWNSSTSRTW